ncbi:MAG: hypothetical protein AAGH19_00230 [Pseudomonadota bacterium]
MLLGLALSACSSGAIRGEVPFVQVNGWSLDNDRLAVELRLRNVNDEALELRRITLDGTVDEGTLLFRHVEDLDIDVAAGGFESITLETTASDAGAALMARLEARELPNLAYRLRGTIDSDDSGDLGISVDGRMYPVPGRSGTFR